jgi:GAF domain-containing protein
MIKKSKIMYGRTCKLNRNKESLIPICGWCKKIRTEQDSWEDIEVYFTRRGLGEFTHSMCPYCAEKIFSKRVYLESYQNICKAISSSLALNEVLKLIASNVVKVMNVKASSVRLLNKETQQLELAAFHGLSLKYANKGPVVYDGSIADALAGKSVSIYDITADEDAIYRKAAIEEGIRSILSIPMRFSDEVIGVLRMYTSEPVEYTGEDLKFVTAIAEQAAIAIVNARMYEKQSKEARYLQTLQEIATAVSSTLSVQEVMDLIVKKIAGALNTDAATIRLLDISRKRLELVAAYGLSERYLSKGPVDAERSVADALDGRPVAILDVSTDNRIVYKSEATEEGIRSLLVIPMTFRGSVIGVLRVLTKNPRTFHEDEIAFATALAEQAAIAIEYAKAFSASAGSTR